jgi:hypothetical protein
MRAANLFGCLTLVGLVSTIGCSSSGKRAGTDSGVSDSGISDSGAPGTDGTTSDTLATDTVAVGRDTVATPDVNNVDERGGGDAGADAAEAGPDGTPDARGSDAVKQGPDGADATDAAVDRSALDGADAGADGRGADAADAGPDNRAIEAGGGDAEGGSRKDEIVRACVKAASCASSLNTYSASRCIQEFGKTASRQDDLKLDRLLACAKAPSTYCSGFTSCWGASLFTLDIAITGGQCSRGVIEVTPAGASYPLSQNCTTTGGVCESLATDVPSVACNARSCSGAEPAEPACSGTTASGCGGLREYTSLDCAWSGQQCQIQGTRAVCAGTGPACSDSDKVTCAGSVATYCARGARATVDCAKTGTATRCAAGGFSLEPCTVAGTECDPLTFVSQCDGNRLTVCVDGSVSSVGCDTVGLVLCFGSATVPAHCVPGV